MKEKVREAMEKHIAKEEILNHIEDGMSLMIGGFLGCGTPHSLMDVVAQSELESLTVIANDTGFPEYGIGRLVVSGQCEKAIVSHIGTNPETGRRMNSGEMDVELVPQGTLAERVHQGGSGLGGFLTPTGVGTIVADGKETIVVGDQEYLLEKPLRADVALIYGTKADKAGNIVFEGSTVNFNPLMAMAADTVICEVEEIVDHLNPNCVRIPGLLVDYIVEGGAHRGQ